MSRTSVDRLNVEKQPTGRQPKRARNRRVRRVQVAAAGGFVREVSGKFCPEMLSPLPLLAALLLPSPPTPPPRALGRRDAVLSGASLAALAAAPGGALAATQRKFYVTDGGVKYFDLQEGECKLFNLACTPRGGDLVKIKYKAFLSNGKMFDSSEGPGRKPLAAKFGSGVLLPGWEEAMETMKEGGTRVIQVPPKLAYGEKGVRIETKDGSVEYLVPPNETLQFELTLLQVGAPPP